MRFLSSWRWQHVLLSHIIIILNTKGIQVVMKGNKVHVQHKKQHTTTHWWKKTTPLEGKTNTTQSKMSMEEKREEYPCLDKWPKQTLPNPSLIPTTSGRLGLSTWLEKICACVYAKCPPPLTSVNGPAEAIAAASATAWRKVALRFGGGFWRLTNRNKSQWEGTN